MNIIIYSLKNYEVNNTFIKNNGISNTIDDCLELLKNNKGYHERIIKGNTYKIYGDIDGTTKKIEDIKEIFKDFYKNRYNLEIENDDIKFTISQKLYIDDVNKKSYHYYIPKFHCSTQKQKEIHQELKKEIKEVDTTIYSTHWFRLPNQTNLVKKDAHIMVDDTIMEDCICQYYDESSTNIEDVNLISKKLSNKKNKQIDNEVKEIIDYNDDEKKDSDNIKYSAKQIEKFVNLLSKRRCDEYEDWINVGICLHNINPNYCYIWDRWSEQSLKYKEGECEERWNTFHNKKNGLSIGSLLRWCKEDNEEKYNQIMSENKLSSLIISKFPNDTLKLGEMRLINKRCKHILLNNDKCIFHKSMHKDMEKSMYIEMFDNNLIIKCKHNDCFCKVYPNEHIQLTKYEMNINELVINNNYITNGEEIVNFQNMSIFEDEELNNLVYNALQGDAVSISNLIFYKTRNKYQYGEDNNWYIFENNKWNLLDNNNYYLRNSITYILTEIYQKVLDYLYENDNDIRKINKIQNIIKNLGNTALKNNIMTELVEIFYLKNNKNRDFVSKLDNNKYFIGFNNGIYDLQNFEFRDGKPEDFISMTVGYNYIDKHTDKFEELLNFLHDIQPNNDDYEYMITYLSICLTQNIHELFTIFNGSGRNGKSKLIELLKLTFGDYLSAINSTFFTRPRPDANSPDPGLLNLAKKKIVIASEPEKKSVLNSGFLKFITGRDSTELRNCHQNNMIKFSPSFTTFLICNDIPPVDDMDNAFAKRLRCINFPTEFVDKNPDVNKNQKLKNTNINENFNIWKMDFILLLIEYYKKYSITKKLEATTNILKWTNMYKEDTDVFLTFLNEKTVKTENINIFLSDLYNEFKIWWKDNNPNEKIPNNMTFKNEIKKHYTIELVWIATNYNEDESKKKYNKKIGIKNLSINYD